MAIIEARQNGREERGGSRLNLILTLLILGSMIFFAVKIVPPYMANYQFQDAIATEARFALVAYPRKSQDDMFNEVWQKAQELGLPLNKQDIHIVISEGTVTISADYTVPIDLKVYQFNLNFHPHADNHTI